MKGRKPQPAAVRAQKAPVRSKRKAAPVVAPVSVGAVSPSRKLKPLAAQVWNALAPKLVAAKLLHDLDAPAFTRYCALTARFEEAERELDKDGLTYWTESAHGKMKRAQPAAMLSLRYSRELASLEASFGLTPADRQRIFADRARGGGPADLFGTGEQSKPDEAVQPEPQPAAPASGPVGMLN